jgi:hypothetical protein
MVLWVLNLAGIIVNNQHHTRGVSIVLAPNDLIEIPQSTLAFRYRLEPVLVCNAEEVDAGHVGLKDTVDCPSPMKIMLTEVVLHIMKTVPHAFWYFIRNKTTGILARRMLRPRFNSILIWTCEKHLF